MNHDKDFDIVSHLDSLGLDAESSRSPVWRFPAESAELTLWELRDLSVRYAHALRSHGVGAGDRVALVLANGSEYVALLLAIWRLNATAVPLALKPRRPSDSMAHLRRVADVCGFQLLVHGADWPVSYFRSFDGDVTDIDLPTRAALISGQVAKLNPRLRMLQLHPMFRRRDEALPQPVTGRGTIPQRQQISK